MLTDHVGTLVQAFTKVNETSVLLEDLKLAKAEDLSNILVDGDSEIVIS